MKNPLNFYKYLPFILRKKFNKKYIVIESDDWGMMGASSEGIHYLANKYGKNNFSRWTTDSIETVSDLELLYDLLNNYKDSFKKPPIITANFITHNINYNHSTVLSFQPLSEYLSQNNGLKGMYEKGIENNYIYPQLHGYCHYNLSTLNDYFQSDSSKELFNLGFLTGESTIRNIPNNFKGELVCHNKNVNLILQNAISEFYKIFGFQSKTIIPPHFILDLKLLNTIKAHGIICIQACNRLIRLNRTRIRKVFFRKQNGLYWFPRTARLDPHEHYKYFADQCLASIAKAFQSNIPAIIDFHRVNLSGKYNESYRDNTLKELNSLFQSIENHWPDVEFISTDELLKKICQI